MVMAAEKPCHVQWVSRKPRRAGGEAPVHVHLQRWDVSESDLSPPEHLFCLRPFSGWDGGHSPLGRADSHQFKCSSYPKNTFKVPPEWCLTSYPATYPRLPPPWLQPCPHMQSTIKTWMVVLFLPGSPWTNIPVWFLQTITLYTHSFLCFETWSSSSFQNFPSKSTQTQVLGLQMTEVFFSSPLRISTTVTPP